MNLMIACLLEVKISDPSLQNELLNTITARQIDRQMIQENNLSAYHLKNI